MASLEAALAEAMAGRGQMVMLAGEPGIGKTRIAQELASHAGSLGVQTFWGRCHAQEGAPPYWPWVQPIRTYIQQTDADVLGPQLGPGAGDIHEIVPEVRDKLPELELPTPLEAVQARFRLFNSIASFLTNVARSQSLLLVLDDLQWADQPSLLLLEFLAEQVPDSRSMLVGTYRDVDLTRTHPLSDSLTHLARNECFHRETLGGLERDNVTSWIRNVNGVEPSQRFAQDIYEHTEGNTFFLNEGMRRLETPRRAF
jgi:predicted ATPase